MNVNESKVIILRKISNMDEALSWKSEVVLL